jgi:hypothetical protein
VVGLALLFLASLVVLPAPPAEAAGFDMFKADAYAEQWTLDTNLAEEGNGKYGNPDFQRYSNDCTNFASQVWMAAGVEMRFNASQASYEWWYYNGDSLHFLTHSGQSSLSWRENNAFRISQMGAWGADLTALNMTQNYTPALLGELYEYDWGTGDGWSHLAVETGWEASYQYYGIGWQSGDYVNQHSRDRVHAPWNYGYLVQGDPNIRANMHARIIGI